MFAIIMSKHPKEAIIHMVYTGYTQDIDYVIIILTVGCV